MSNKNFKINSFATPSAFDPRKEEVLESSQNNILSTFSAPTGGNTRQTAVNINLFQTVVILTSLSDSITYYNISDGIEGQLLYLVTNPVNTNSANIDINVENARTNNTPFTNGLLLPFQNDGQTGVTVLLFTSGSWQIVSGGYWDD